MDKKYINKTLEIEKMRHLYETYLQTKTSKPRQDYIVLPTGGKGTGEKYGRTVYAG